MREHTVIVIGGGPAGMMAAIRAAQLTQQVILIEKNPTLGRKLLLSGKGRCNLTNACELDEFLARFSKNGQFLRDAFKKFFNTDLMQFFESRGLALKTERQLRVFPVTDRSSSIVSVLEKALRENAVTIMNKTAVSDIVIKDGAVTGVITVSGKNLASDRIILATGGLSYGFTGSTGEGIALAGKTGHGVIEARPGLVALETRRDNPRRLEGLALKNIRVVFFCGRRSVSSEIGELMFTDFGISGPLVLTLSGQIADALKKKETVTALIDFKPALSKEQLHERLLREVSAGPNMYMKNMLKTLLPQRLIPVFMEKANVSHSKTLAHMTLDERRRIVELLKEYSLTITATRPLEEAMVTQGGVKLSDINPKTMESRRIRGLYFAGEMIDVDADTGGFNLQAAFSTGYLAGESAAQ